MSIIMIIIIIIIITTTTIIIIEIIMSRIDHTNKWYMHNSESALENEMHKILSDFEIQTDHLILARWPDQLIVNKKRKPAE